MEDADLHALTAKLELLIQRVEQASISEHEARLIETSD